MRAHTEHPRMSLFGKSETKGNGGLDRAFISFLLTSATGYITNPTATKPCDYHTLESFFDWLRLLETRLPDFLLFLLNVNMVSHKAICFLHQQHHLLILCFKYSESDYIKVALILFLLQDGLSQYR